MPGKLIPHETILLIKSGGNSTYFLVTRHYFHVVPVYLLMSIN